MKKYWDKTIQYQRILEILDDYWTTQKDEAYVEVDMQFVHKNGECQMKHLIWRHPDIESKQEHTGPISLKRLSEIEEKPDPFRELLKRAGIT